MSAREGKAQRTCLGCRQIFNQDLLVRFVRSPDGQVLADYRHRLPGRGAYTCPKASCLETVVKKKQFDRAFKAACQAETLDSLLTSMQLQLSERILGLIGMARKSSMVISGSGQVLDALGGRDKPALVIMGKDVSPGIAEKVTGKAAHQEVFLVQMFDKQLLGKIVGKGERSVIALKAGRLGETCSREVARYKDLIGEF